MTEYFALTDHGSVAAEKVIVATHFPFINRRGSYFVKLYQERSYVLSLKIRKYRMAFIWRQKRADFPCAVTRIHCC